MSVSIDGTGSLIGVDQGLNIVGLTTLTGGIILDDSISHIGDTDTKIRFPAADTFTVETAGSERLRINQSGQVTIFGEDDQDNFIVDAVSGTQFTIHQDASDGEISIRAQDGSGNNYVKYMTFFTEGGSGPTERLRITSGGDLFVAGTGGMNTTQLPNGSTINVNGTSSNDGLSVIRYSTGYGAYGLNIGRSKSNTIGTNAAVTDGNDLGHITFYGADGTDFNQAAMITAQVDGTPSDGTDMPGRLVFKTSSDASATPTERLRITSGGIIQCGTSSVLKAEINNAVSGHQFISQCSDNNNGFEVYQQHASNTTRNNFAVYANTGSGNAKDLQFSVRGDGCVTKPNNPAFLAGRTGGNQTFTVGTFPLNLARINVGNCWNTSTYKFTAPVAGVYYFYAQVYYNNGAGQYRMHFRKTPNGGSAFQLNTSSHKIDANHPGGANDTSDSMSIVESLAVGDSVELYSDQNHSIQCYYNLNNTTYGAHTYMMGYLIG